MVSLWRCCEEALAGCAWACLRSDAGASAADLGARPYTKAPVTVAPVVNWTGFYIGAEVAVAGATTPGRCRFWEPQVPHRYQRRDAGGVIGYNWQSASNIVLGVEGNLNWADIKGK